MMVFKSSKDCLMKSFAISMLLLLEGINTGCEITPPSANLLRPYQSSLSPIPHADRSGLKKSTSVRYAAGNGLIWLNIAGKIAAPIRPIPQRQTDERGVKKSSTQPKPRRLIPRSSSKELQQKPSVFNKTNLNSTLSPSKHTGSSESIFEGYHRLKGKIPARTAFSFPRHQSGTKPFPSSNRRYSTKIENDRGTNFSKTFRDPHENGHGSLQNVLISKRNNPFERRSVPYSEKRAKDTNEHRTLEDLLNQYAPSFGTKQERLDEENTITKIEELDHLSAMAPRDLNPLDIRTNNLRDLDVSVGEMEPWEHRGYIDGQSFRRSRIADVRKFVNQKERPLDTQDLYKNTYPNRLHERKVRELPDYFERYPKVSTMHRLPFNRAPPIERFPKPPSITEQEHETFPTSDLFPPDDDISDEYTANREPVAPEEDQPIDEPEPAPEPVPEPEPAPIPELPSIKEIPPIKEPEAPAQPNLDPKKTFDTGESNGGEKKTLQTEEHT